MSGGTPVIQTAEQRRWLNFFSGWYNSLTHRLSLRVMAPLLLGCGIWATGAIQPGQASDRLVLSYGPIRLPVSLDSLEAYAHSGMLDSDLAPYLQHFEPQIHARLRASLSTQLQLSPQQLKQLLYSPLGERMLSGVSALSVQPEALRQAILQAAEAETGLSLLNILRQFPQTTQIDLYKISQLWQRYRAVQQKSESLLQAVERSQTPGPDSERLQSYPPASRPLSDLRQPGDFRFEHRLLQFHDHQRSRTLAVDFYLPSAPPAVPLTVPPQTKALSLPQIDNSSNLSGTPRSLIIISHGLGSDRRGHAFFAKHLASHGIAAAVVQHPGSDSEQVQAMLQGKAQAAIEVNTFIERPRDISFLLDELEQRNAAEFGGQLRLDQVGLYGHSLGAYTALALAGATFNFSQLEADCRPEAYLLNLSMVLQCQALELPRRNYQLQDQRIALLMLFDPVSSSILDSATVQLPVFWGGSNADVVTPLVVEQLPAFERLGSHRKYLSLLDGIQHMNIQLDYLTQARGLDDQQLIQPKPQAFQDSVNALGLAFVQVYLSDRSEYSSYLNPAYAQRLSQAPHQLRFLAPRP